MSGTGVDVRVETGDEGGVLVWLWRGRRALSSPAPASIEIGVPSSLTPSGKRHSLAYRHAAQEGEAIAAGSEIVLPEGVFRLTDRWRRLDETAWRVDRGLEIVDVANPLGVRLLL
jgi:hypothetical protein